MKKQAFYLVLCGIFMLTSMQAASAQSFTFIKGHFNFNSEAKDIKLQYVVDGQLETYATTLIDEKGNFGFTVPVNEPGFFYLDYGQMKVTKGGQLVRFYLESGLDIDITIDEKNYTLSGKKLGHNLLVQKANKVYDEFTVYAKLGGNVTYEDFFPFLENHGVKKVREFESTINTKDKEFNNLLKLAVQADFEGVLYAFFRLPRSKHPEKDNRPAIYSELKKDLKFTNANILRLGNGLKWMEGYFFYHEMQNDFKTGRLNFISEDIKHISEDRLKEVYVLDRVKNGGFKPEEYKKVIQPLYQYLTSEKSKDFLVAYEKELHKNIGQPGFNFTYTDVNDKPVSFSDFKGKYVYVDVWATWCGPCKKEIPFLKELEHEYKGKDIVFMSVSVDEIKDRQKWKDFVKNEKLGGVQLMADKAFKSGITENYEINGIPRFLLFDKEGKIISTDAMRPSNPELRNQFDELLGKAK